MNIRYLLPERFVDDRPSAIESLLWNGLSWATPSWTWIGQVADDPYKYQTLGSPTTIRLIKIYRMKVKGHIACSIDHFDEEEQRNIQYQALSYVWGDPQPTRKIYLKGTDKMWHPFPLHENLWQFLDHAWRQGAFDRFFWTDRLCLDQNSAEETSQQVPRMRSIYYSADRVLVWLNLKEEEERGLLELVRNYDFLRHRPKAEHNIEETRASIDQDAISGLVKNPYWTRVWIVQEVAVARKVCVASRYSFITLNQLSSLLNCFCFETYVGNPWIHELSQMSDHLRSSPLSRILTKFSEHKSSKLADRVYGLLGLVEDYDDGSSPTDNIQVDYDKPPEHVFLDAMFESSPTLTEYMELPKCLGDWKAYDSKKLLQDYITHIKTTQRHKNFAQLALTTLEAFNIIKSVPGAPDKDTIIGITHNIFKPLIISCSPETTAQENAAMIGLVLARSSSGPLNHWKARWRSSFGESSPWRCAAHGSVDISLAGTSSYGKTIGTSATGPWSRDGVVEACGERSQSCDGSVMTCEIPQVGLRFLLPAPGHESSLILQRKGWDEITRHRNEAVPEAQRRRQRRQRIRDELALGPDGNNFH